MATWSVYLLCIRKGSLEYGRAFSGILIVVHKEDYVL